MSKLLLIDGHSQAYRAYFGVKTPLATSAGELTTAVFGFARKLLSVLKEYQPDYLGVAFDLGDTWRHKTYTEYKGTRERMPDDLRSQMGRIEQLLETFNIPIITYPDYEADDILGTLAHQAAAQGIDAYILTGDRDLFQLVSERVKILYTPGGPRPQTVVYGLEEVMERYGLTPEQFIDMKALTGDSSDNIPGVPGVGDKTAIKFLKNYETLDGLYAHVDEISGPKTRQNLLDAQEQVQINRKLVTIVTDLDLTFTPENYRTQDYDQNAVIAFFNELEFRSLIKELPQGKTPPTFDSESGQLGLFGKTSQSATASSQDGLDENESSATSGTEESEFLLVQDEATLNELIEALSTAKQLSFDVETDSTDAIQARLVGLGIAWEAGQRAYIPVAHTEGTQLPWEQVSERVQPFFANQAVTKLAHNSKYDVTVCIRHGLQIVGDVHDTMVMAWVLNPASRRLGLKALAEDELNWQMTELTDLIGTGRKQITIDQVALEQAGAYCADDVDATIRLYDIFEPRLKEASLFDLYREIELPLLPALTDMEIAGIRLDINYLGDMSAQLEKRLTELMEELYKIAGRSFNLRSTQQLSQVLFDELAFPTKGMKKTRSGHYSTAAAELERLANAKLSATQQQVLDIILEHRQLEKLRGTYVDALPTLVNPETGRVHTSFNQAGAVTGRMSSSNPNLQNIPIRTEIGRRIRKAFVAEPDWQLLAADYSQVELRILAHITQEPDLVKTFQADQDVHAATASRLFGVALDQVTDSQRSLAKTINFATIYGISAFGLSNRTDMNPKQAQEFLDQYFETYPKVKQYITDTIQMAKDKGYVQTLLGRKRFFPELQSGRLPFSQRSAIERAAINAPVQGTNADIMKIAMIRLHKRLHEENYQTRMLLQVHDELVLEVPPAERDAIIPLVREVMESAYVLDVPLKVDVEIGNNWYDMEKATV
ncbi:DNA polymerase I [Chloroflexi bacterium TSY]|nr:DNA polymerase I [Chloroflexi bacterium TSY]